MIPNSTFPITMHYWALLKPFYLNFSIFKKVIYGQNNSKYREWAERCTTVFYLEIAF